MQDFEGMLDIHWHLFIQHSRLKDRTQSIIRSGLVCFHCYVPVNIYQSHISQQFTLSPDMEALQPGMAEIT